MKARNALSGKVRYQPARFSLGACAALFLTGMAYGAAEYASRPAVTGRHSASANAITVEALIALAAAAVVISIQAWRWRRPGLRGSSPWAAPFSAAALARLRRTLRPGPGVSAVSLARAAGTAVLILVLAYAPFRMGAQITSGLDPAATVNAWGGPTYTGALLAHWLDCLAGFYGAAFLLSRVLAPAARQRPAGPALRGGAVAPGRATV